MIGRSPRVRSYVPRIGEAITTNDASRWRDRSRLRVQPLTVWAGPTDTAVIPETDEKTDPNGKVGVGLLAMLFGLVP